MHLNDNISLLLYLGAVLISPSTFPFFFLFSQCLEQCLKLGSAGQEGESPSPLKSPLRFLSLLVFLKVIGKWGQSNDNQCKSREHATPKLNTSALFNAKTTALWSAKWVCWSVYEDSLEILLVIYGAVEENCTSEGNHQGLLRVQRGPNISASQMLLYSIFLILS